MLHRDEHHGRGATVSPKNKYDKLSVEYYEDFAGDIPEEELEALPQTEFYDDSSRSIITSNDSPDVGFTYSINPYRGCEHGCIYCYARPSHQYLGFNAGIDFETKIMVKRNAATLLRAEFMKKSWKPEVVAIGTNTDCYQPAERRLRITRSLLEVFLEFRNPVGLISKNFLITRDVDILSELAKLGLVSASISITSLDPKITEVMEPRTSRPERRLKAVEILAKNGIPVSVNIAPVIPGLNDEEIPSILKAIADHGAQNAGIIMVRLPDVVEPVFLDWLDAKFPLSAEKIKHRIREVRGGKLYNSNFGTRMRGEGEIADMIHRIFNVTKKKYGLTKRHPPLRTDLFRRPLSTDKNQMQLL